MIQIRPVGSILKILYLPGLTI